MKTTEKAGKATAAKEVANSKEVKAAAAKAAATAITPDTGKAAEKEPENKAIQPTPKAVGAAVAAQPEATAAQQPPQQPKFAMNLEETLKLVEELHRRKRQRDRLIETIDNLESFEIEQKEDADETDGNYYQGCKLTIEDDNRKYPPYELHV